MAFLSTDELSDLRTHFTATLPETCAISYNSPVTTYGRTSDNWVSRGTAIACRLAPASIGMQAGISQETVMEGQMWLLSLDYNQTVALSDKVTHSGKEYRVIQANTGTSEHLLRRVMLVRWE